MPIEDRTEIMTAIGNHDENMRNAVVIYQLQQYWQINQMCIEIELQIIICSDLEYTTE